MSANKPWLHRFSLLLAACTLALFVTGAFVTSNEERPFYSFGQFHFPIVWTVGVLALSLVIWLWLAKTSGLLRPLGWIVLGTFGIDIVVGMQTNSESPSIGASHAFLAQLLFSATVVIALFTSSGWNRDPQPPGEPGRASLASLTIMTLALTLIQVGLGVALRHGLIGVALHILGAFLVVLLMLILAVIISRRAPGHPTLRPAATTAATIVSVQAFLGFTILTMQGSRLIDPVALIVAAAIHATVGALALASVVVMALLIRRNLGAAAPK